MGFRCFAFVFAFVFFAGLGFGVSFSDFVWFFAGFFVSGFFRRVH